MKRRKPDRHAVAIGMAASVLAHLLLVVLNPAFHLEYEERGPASHVTGSPGAITALGLTVSADEETVGLEPPSAQQTSPAGPAVSPPVSGAGAGSVDRVDPATAAERLRYRESAVWDPPPEVVLSAEERRRQMIAERIQRAIDDPTVGALPPAAPERRFSMGVRIPFGRKPPGPAQVVAAPLPDSVRPETIRRLPPDTLRRRNAGQGPVRRPVDLRRASLPVVRPDSLPG